MIRASGRAGIGASHMRRIAKALFLSAMVAIGVGGFTTTSWAVLVITPGNTGSLPDDNVINNACGSVIDGPALTIQGCLNSDHSVIVNFTSDENIEYAAGGQAKIVASDGLFSTLTVSLVSGTFQSLILNIDATKLPKDAVDPYTVTFIGNPGSPPAQTFTLDANGQNFFTITGESFNSVTFTTNYQMASFDAVQDVKQVRLGTGSVAVPEPGILLLLGTGAILLGFIGSRRGMNDARHSMLGTLNAR